MAPIGSLYLQKIKILSDSVTWFQLMPFKSGPWPMQVNYAMNNVHYWIEILMFYLSISRIDYIRKSLQIALWTRSRVLISSSDGEGSAVCEIVHTKSESEGRPERTFQLCCRWGSLLMEVEFYCRWKIALIRSCLLLSTEWQTKNVPFHLPQLSRE